jgi:hypothetical protein
MATTLYLRTSTSVPLVTPYKGHLTLHVTPAGDLASTLSASTVDTGVDERQFLSAGLPADFWSGAAVSQHTQTGTVTVNLFAKMAVADADLRLRARLFKITAGGSDVETLIVSIDAAASLTAVYAAYNFSASIPVAVTLAPGERYILRLYVFPFTGGWGSGSPVASAEYDNVSVSGYVVLPVTAVPADNDGPLYLRRTSTIGIGNFLDMLAVRGSTATTSSDVLSTAGGTEIQWTRVQQLGTLAVTEITAAVIASTSNATTYASASFTPVANRLYLLAVVHSDAAPEATVPTIATTTGLNFVQVGSSIAFDSIASNLHRITLFRAMKPSGLSAGTYTVTLADAGTGCAALLAEVTGVVTTGTDGADAIRNNVTRVFDATSNPSVIFGGYSQIFNGFFACFGSSLQTAPTPESGWTALSDPDYNTPPTGLYAQWRNSPTDTSSACTLASSAWAGIGVELIAASSVLALEWVSPRFKSGWDVTAAAQFAGAVFAAEASTAANCALRANVFRRKPDGTESLIYTVTTAELDTAPPLGSDSMVGGTVTPTSCVEDDRLVVRVYITNVGTMAAGHVCTVYYDHNAAGGLGDSFLSFLDPPGWKAEGDPSGGETPSKMTMTGMGS